MDEEESATIDTQEGATASAPRQNWADEVSEVEENQEIPEEGKREKIREGIRKEKEK